MTARIKFPACSSLKIMFKPSPTWIFEWKHCVGIRLYSSLPFFWNLRLVVGDCHDESCPNEGDENRKTPANPKLAKQLMIQQVDMKTAKWNANKVAPDSRGMPSSTGPKALTMIMSQISHMTYFKDGAMLFNLKCELLN